MHAPMSEQMTGGEAVVRSLVANQVDTLFGMPGVHNLAVYDALLDTNIRHIVARHEQGAAFMADGYARASGKIGVCLVTSGPALLNTATPLGTSYCDSIPVLVVASQIPSAAIGKEKGYIHECRDQLGCVRPVASWCKRAEDVASIPRVMDEAFTRLRSGRPRPVVVEIPCDILDGCAEVSFSTAARPTVRTKSQQREIANAVRLLQEARRPVILAGGGLITSGGSGPLRLLAERLDAPVFTTVLGKGAIPEDHPLAAGSCAIHSLARDYVAGCDVMLAVGTRFTDEETVGFTMQFPANLIHLDVDAEEIGRNYPASVGIVGDALDLLERINEQLDAKGFLHGKSRAREVAQLRAAIVEDCRQLAPSGVELVETLQTTLPREAIVVSDLALAAYWCRRLLDTYHPRSYLYPWGFCTLGYGVPAAIGAKVARPDLPVVLLSGDGGFMFNCQELAVAAQFEIPLVLLIFNNGGFGVMKPQQQQRYGRTLAVDLVNPDFPLLARSFGLEARRLATIAELGPALGEAIDSERGWLIEVTAEIPLQVMEPAPRSLHETLSPV